MRELKRDWARRNDLHSHGDRCDDECVEVVSAASYDALWQAHCDLAKEVAKMKDQLEKIILGFMPEQSTDEYDAADHVSRLPFI